MLKSREYPDLWKLAQIAPQPICNSTTGYNQYRPIPQVFYSGKLAEEVTIRKMRHKLDAVIQPSQYAYKAGVSTTDALFQYLVFSNRYYLSRVPASIFQMLLTGYSPLLS